MALVRYFISVSEIFRLDSSSKNLLLSFSMKPHAPIETLQYTTLLYDDFSLFITGLYYSLFLVLLPAMFISKPTVSPTSVTVLC